MSAEPFLGTVAALAGRRIDAPGAVPPRFPLARAAAVKAALAEAFALHGVAELVCSAACGADLLALMAAQELGVRRRIILPFALGAFRRISVVDRPGDWGPFYDRLVADARATGDLIVLDGLPGDEEAYDRANRAIVGEAASGDRPRLAILVWEGRARDASDATEGFRRLALGAGFRELTVPTC